VEDLAGLFVSADSHVSEHPGVWKGLLDESFFPNRGDLSKRGGGDPTQREAEMREDGVGAEVLYPTLGMSLFAIDDVELHEAACRAYDRWLVEYTAADPARLVGVALIPCYRPKVAIDELRYCKAAGLRGAMVWQVPHPDLPFTSSHYDPIWQVVAELEMPLHIHLFAGFTHRARPSEDQHLAYLNHYRTVVNASVTQVADALFSFIFGGVFDRFPGLRLVIVENEVSWLPFYLAQWDFAHQRFGPTKPLGLTKLPSQYFADQVFLTFFRDPWVGRMLASWGGRNLMWSNDFPHTNSTWPKSHDYVAATLTGIDEETKDRVLRRNCLELYKIDAEAAGVYAR
jgi:predicted TIM-barrel fold metal-dependent hydrolase